MPNSSIKNEKMYEDLCKEGNSKQKAARISNAAAARGKSSAGKKGGKSGSYDDWNRAAVEEARQGTRLVRLFESVQGQTRRQVA